MSGKTIKWSRYIPNTPSPKQLEALRLSEKELLYGGALGGGKSDFLLMCGLQYADVPGYSSMIFRKSLTDAKLPGALLSRAREWLSPFMRSAKSPSNPCHYVPNEHTFYFNTYNPDGTKGAPACLCFGFIGDANVKDRYQSAEFQTICFDELSHWATASDYEYMTTRLRKTVCKTHGKHPDGKPNYIRGCLECQLKSSMPVRIRAATNPGGLGGAWIMKKFQIIPDPSIYKDRREALAAINNGEFVPFVGSHPDRAFVPAYITDNPHLDQEDYDQFLNNLEANLKSQLKDGNWLARSDTRFKRGDARYYRLYNDSYEKAGMMYPLSSFVRIFITVDPAGTLREGMVDQETNKNRNKSYTVISTWGVTESNDLYWLDMVRFRDEIPEVVAAIKRAYQKWQPSYVKIEVNGIGLGVGQYVSKLGIPVKKIQKGTDKLENSTAAQLLMSNGKVFLPENTPWIDECEDEIFQWSGLPAESDDIVDTLSDASIDLGVIDKTEDSEEEVITKVNSLPSSRFQSVGSIRQGSAFHRILTSKGMP